MSARAVECVSSDWGSVQIVEDHGRYVLLQVTTDSAGCEQWHCDEVGTANSHYASRSLDDAARYQRRHVRSYARLSDARRAAKAEVSS